MTASTAPFGHVGDGVMGARRRCDPGAGRRSRPDPIGYIAYPTDGRVIAPAVQKDQATPCGPVPNDEEKIALFESMIAYAGRYTLDDERVVHHVDASWNQGWTGTDVVAVLRPERDTLTLKGAPAVDPYTGEEVVYLIAFRRPRGAAEVRNRISSALA